MTIDGDREERILTFGHSPDADLHTLFPRAGYRVILRATEGLNAPYQQSRLIRNGGDVESGHGDQAIARNLLSLGRNMSDYLATRRSEVVRIVGCKDVLWLGPNPSHKGTDRAIYA